MNSITFLGTGGARVMLATQQLATGGMAIKIDDTFFSLDPGPGALLQFFKHGLDPGLLDGIIISHRHLDHTADANIMIEAMTKGGIKKKGSVFAPADALDTDPVILKYLRNYLEKIIPLNANSNYKINTLLFNTSMSLRHGSAETYGFIFQGKDASVGYIPDTAFFPELVNYFQADILIISMLRLEPSPFLHLSLKDVENLVMVLKPHVTILTHFGFQVYRYGPENLARSLSTSTGQQILAARDGLSYYFI